MTGLQNDRHYTSIECLTSLSPTTSVRKQGDHTNARGRYDRVQVGRRAAGGDSPMENIGWEHNITTALRERGYIWESFACRTADHYADLLDPVACVALIRKNQSCCSHVYQL